MNSICTLGLSYLCWSQSKFPSQVTLILHANLKFQIPICLLQKTPSIQQSRLTLPFHAFCVFLRQIYNYYLSSTHISRASFNGADFFYYFSFIFMFLKIFYYYFVVLFGKFFLSLAKKSRIVLQLVSSAIKNVRL